MLPLAIVSSRLQSVCNRVARVSGTADGISRVLRSGACGGVTLARALLANPDLPNLLAAGRTPAAPCTFCNKCLAHVIENPLGCYEEARFVGRGGREELIRQVMAIFENEVEAD